MKKPAFMKSDKKADAKMGKAAMKADMKQDAAMMKKMADGGCVKGMGGVKKDRSYGK